MATAKRTTKATSRPLPSFPCKERVDLALEALAELDVAARAIASIQFGETAGRHDIRWVLKTVSERIGKLTESASSLIGDDLYSIADAEKVINVDVVNSYFSGAEE